MIHRIKYWIIMTAALVLLASCEHDEPVNPIKPVSERTLLAIDIHGNIYDIHGNLIKTLPDCQSVTQIIVEGSDYFVSGVNTKDKVGYWKNGKWNTLHVDFIDDVDHWVYGIAKWDYNIYLLDYPNVLRNSGIFRLKDSEDFIPSRHGMSVSEGKCYVVGMENLSAGEFEFIQKPVIYTERKGTYEKNYMPLPAGCTQGQCLCVYAYDRTHYVVGGVAGQVAAVWEDEKVYNLPRFFNNELPAGFPGTISSVNEIGKANGHIYAAGTEYGDKPYPVSILWIDGVPQKLIYDTENPVISSVGDMTIYGDDVYVLTQESPLGTAVGLDDIISVVWMNGEPFAKFSGQVTSIAVY